MSARASETMDLLDALFVALGARAPAGGEKNQTCGLPDYLGGYVETYCMEQEFMRDAYDNGLERGMTTDYDK